ncbi:MAG: ParB/RepB/Spo0J family partition protein [Spirochaetes bacterium]|nr:ParB/RepB/Spo0J family partition protein [Spirochaetota bacterium]
MAKNKKGLGMGLDALLKMNVQDIPEDNDPVRETESNEEKVIAGFVELPIDKIVPNPDQPRKNFDEESLNELAQSIKNFGLIQPITVVKKEHIYEIVAGERRYRASIKAGLEKIPVIIKDISQRKKLEMSLVENIQRENLNAIEEALAFSSLIESYSITQEELADSIGKNRTTITNSIRLLNLDVQIRRWIMDGKLTSGHGRAILSLEDNDQHLSFASYIINNNLSVREAESTAKKWPFKKDTKTEIKHENKSLQLHKAEEKLQRKFQTKVLFFGNEKKGKIQIDYYSTEELERILEVLDINL